SAKLSPEFKQDVAADRNAAEEGAADTGVVEHAGEVEGVLFHGDRALACVGVAVGAQVGQDDAGARGEGLLHGQPEFVVRREGLQENQGSAVPADSVTDFGLPAADAVHAGNSKSRRGNRKKTGLLGRTNSLR